MKAAVIDEPGGAPHFGEFPDPVPEPGRELVDIVAAGIHPVVRSLASGRHYGSHGSWPLVPGIDAVGRTRDGVLVYTGYPQPPWGTLAERLSAPSGGVPLPGGADPAQIAGGLNPGLASWMPLELRARAQPLETVLVLGATGMAGLLAVQNARVLGARHVVAVGRSAAGLQRATELGATSTAQLTGDRQADAGGIRQALGDASPAVVIDLLWGAPAEAVFAALTGAGLAEDENEIAYIGIGSGAGPEAGVPSALLRSRKVRISGRGLGANDVAALVEQLPRYMGLVGDGTITVPIQTFPLSRVAEAWAAAAQSGRRVVVLP